ncbi:MAG: ATPase/5-3 helicase helicase subunit RecD of the DNA repair enzyme RecBCD [Candidatus Alkanophagales archaeon MCA70_species_1]|nr:ATPase/5-3 helicase helicase subunit RecD of the DNA repair enzyme RecBCD [Candidatus Alkanophaga volatiphilum]
MKKIDRLLSIAWKERGRYPGFRNLLFTYLKYDYPEDFLTTIINEFEEWVRNTYGDFDNFLANVKNIENIPSRLIKVITAIKKNLEEIKFLSQFDLTIPQFENIKADILSKIGLDELKSNPYILFEKYSYDKVYTWDIDKSDYGIDLYHIDIALIPDVRYAKWSTEYSAQSPQRIRALIVKILNDAASQNGDSCLVRSDILKRIEDYPLYYINERFRLNEKTLIDYEKETLFKERFVIKTELQDAVYQLKELREIEEHIENVINKLASKKYKPDHEYVERIIEEEKGKFKDRININERRRAYVGALSNGLFILTGKAGSGKTQAIVELVKKFIEENKVPIYIFTPTGKANLVIKNRIKNVGLYDFVKSKRIEISTIHRFLYRRLVEYIQYMPTKKREIYRLTDLVSDILSGRWDLFKDFLEISKKGWKFNPSVVIIDEASMVDEILLGALFCMINIDNLKHLILVGDDRQLPPIGVGRPLADIIFYLRKKELEDKIVRLESNLRFSPDSGLGMLTELFGGNDPPSITEIEQILKKQDETFKIDYFTDVESIKGKMVDILRSLLHQSKEESIFNLFSRIFKGEQNKISLDRVQIISPRRVGNFGTMAINQNVVMNGNVQFLPQTKLICEENIYYTIRDGEKDERILALANGSIGYLDDREYIRFDEIDELLETYGWQKIKDLIFNIKNEIHSLLQIDRKIDLGYAITVHKSQGSDFDNVIFILPEATPFITRELMYTALTRAKNQLYVLVNEDLKQELPLILSRIYDNSAIEQRKTLLFEFKKSPLRAYSLRLKDGRIIELKSKIEYIIASILDESGIKFEYEPEDFWLEYRIKPDFKLIINGENYYWEHLGLMEYRAYRNRWFYKKQIYEKLGIIDKLITTTEGEKALIEESIKNIIKDLRSRNLKTTENSYSKHHYEI